MVDDMKIVDANTITAKDDILKLLAKIDQPNLLEQLDRWLRVSLGTDIFGAWLALENDKPVGLITCEIVEPQEPKCFIAFNYVRPGIEINGELIRKVENWAKEKNIHRLIVYTKQSPQTWIKKHNFTLVRTILEKKI